MDVDAVNVSEASFAVLVLIGIGWTVGVLRRKSSIREMFCLTAYWAMLAAFAGFMVRMVLLQMRPT